MCFADPNNVVELGSTETVVWVPDSIPGCVTIIEVIPEHDVVPVKVSSAVTVGTIGVLSVCKETDAELGSNIVDDTVSLVD